MIESIENFLQSTGIARLIDGGWLPSLQVLVMLVIAGVLVYLAIVKGFEPLLLLPIAVGMLLTNIPGGGMFHLDLFLQPEVDYLEVFRSGGDFVREEPLEEIVQWFREGPHEGAVKSVPKVEF